ncbi:MAG: sensor histidine kinase [Acidobacteriota bacterium]
MSSRPIASIISRSLIQRTLIPAMVCLIFLAVIQGIKQKNAVESKNQDFARTLALYTEAYMDGAYHSLEHFADAPPSVSGVSLPQRLKDMLAVMPSMDRLILTDARNTILSAEPAGPRGLDFPIRFDNVHGRRHVLSRPLPSPQSGVLTVFIGVERASGGVLAGELNLFELTNHIFALSRSLPGEIILCDGFGNLVSHPEPSQVATQTNIGDSPLFKAAKQGQATQIYLDDGGLYLGTHAVIPELGWLVLVRTPAAAAMAPALAPVIGTAMVMAFVFVTLTLLLRRELDKRIASPMAQAATRLDRLPRDASFKPIPDPPFAELGRFEAAVEDMTERVLSGEAHLRESERRFRAIFEQAAVGLVQCTPDGHFLRANKRFIQICGYSPQELSGMNLRELTLPEDRQGDLASMRLVLSGHLPSYDMDKCLRTRDGETVWVHLTASAVRNDEGEVRSFIVVLEDVTARKNAEKAVTDSLCEKEILLREIHHRVKNNLQIISSLLYLQSDHVSDPEALGMFLESRNRIASMALVHEELYRSDDLSSVNIREYALKLVPRLVAAFHSGKGIRCTIEADDVCLVIGQAIPFGLVINELVTNAAKHAFVDRQSGTISVIIHGVDGMLQASVSDDGVGLPPDFDPAATSTLGMQLVVQLTRQLRGELTQGGKQGTSFTLSFPVTEARFHESD